MVFSFFKKGKADDEPMPAPKAKAPTAPAVVEPRPEPTVEEMGAPIEQLTTMIGDLSSLGGMVVEESGFEVSGGDRSLSPVAEEAAIYYANNKPLDAIRVLKEWISSPAAREDVQPWYMLFDLYQLSSMHEAFDDLCIPFVETFLCSPPLWRGKTVEKQQPAKPVAAAGKPNDYLALTGVISVDSEAQITQMRGILEKYGQLQLDVSKIQALESSGSGLLLQTLQKFRRSGAKMQLGGTGNLIGLLKKLIADGTTAAEHWLLLLEIYQLLGKESEFEDLAIEYAVTLEVSPPSWEAAPKSVMSVESEEAPAAEEEKPSDVFHASGEIAGNIQPMLEQFRAYSDVHSKVVVDMADVSRVDFVSVGDLLNELVALQGSGKQATLLNVNEPVIALFQTMGLDGFVTIQRAKDRTVRAKK